MDKFTKVRNIGKGNMGACALARNNDDGKYYVIKQVDLTRMNKKERQQSLNEARVLSSLRHPNIINYVDSFLAKKSDHLCIVMEFADGGDISSRIKKNYGVNFRESLVLDWFIQLTLSLHYVHQRKILHRDVKTQNVFLTSDNIVKLGDFGIARTLSNTYDQAKTFVGTPYYLSPELILERPYDHRSDVWALGVVLYELLTLKHPFNANDMKGLMQRILKVQYDPIPMIYSTEVRSIVPRLLMKDPAQRIQLTDILQLPVIRRRITEWLHGDVMPQRYIDALLKQKLLPNDLLESPELPLKNGSVGSAHAKTAGQDRSHGGEDGREDTTDSEGGHTRSDGPEPRLPPVGQQPRYTPSVAGLDEIHSAPPTSRPGPSTARSNRGTLMTDCGPISSHNVNTKEVVDRAINAPSQRASRAPPIQATRAAPSVGGIGGRQPPQQLRTPQSYRYYKTPSSNVNVAPPLYGVRHHRNQPPAPAVSRPSPLPPRLSSLDNFYQQLNYYQQHRSGGVGAGGLNLANPSGNGNNNYYSSRQPGLNGQPPFSGRNAGGGASPPAHIPVTVLSSRRVSRKRSEALPSKVVTPARAKPLSRPTNTASPHGAGGFLAPDAAGAPDIKAMLQRAAQERAQRRHGEAA